jgi:A/G-specific adenine glycosylase
VKAVQRVLLRWYGRHGRSDLPWRRRRNAYHTLVSEIMLQQTQVERVVPKFQAFIAKFPTIAALASVSRADVLREWRGLGYNSRAVRLHAIAREVVAKDGGVLPRDRDALLALHGIGEYTARAISAFAYELDDAPMDTNVRRVVHRLRFGAEFPAKAKAAVLQREALTLVPEGRSHDWNSALMDLGATICTARAPKCLLCPLRSHCKAAPIDAAALERLRAKYARRNGNALPFKRTARYARGRIVDRLRELPPGQRISLLDLHRDLSPIMPERTPDDVRALLDALAADGLVKLDGENVSLC